ncbi:hypothetical protein RSOL_325580, partial [Rhizoctonia solani AG-3 Rhs1AP]
MAKSAEARAAEKVKRKAQDERRYKIAAAAAEIEEALYEMIESKANVLDVEVGDILSRFLLYATARTSDSKATVWNGLVHVKSKEWADMKEDYPGSAFIGYVVERIQEENLYNIDKMNEEDKEIYVEAARKSRAAKINAGAAKTSTQRLVQGSVKNEISAMVQRMDFLHSTTGIEYLLFAVKGKPQDGLIGMYHASPKAQAFLENHLALPISHFVELLEGSVLGGPIGALNSHRTPTQIAKSLFRQDFLKSLRVAATSAAEDGSAPAIVDPLEITMVEYKNYPNIIRQYKVVSNGWPTDDNGSLVDPGTMGLGRLRAFTKLINDPTSGYGFKRITDTEWKDWCKKYDQDVAGGTLALGKRKTRSDAGKKRKKDSSNTVDALEMAQSMTGANKKGVEKSKKSNTTKRSRKKIVSKSADRSSPIAEVAHENVPTSSDSQDPVRSPTADSDEVPTNSLDQPQPFTFTPPDDTPVWPLPAIWVPSTPKPQKTPPPSSPMLTTNSAEPGPSTPGRTFRFIHNTPESVRSRACTPRPQRLQSPAVRPLPPPGRPLSQHSVFQGTDTPLVLDPALQA